MASHGVPSEDGEDQPDSAGVLSLSMHCVYLNESSRAKSGDESIKVPNGLTGSDRIFASETNGVAEVPTEDPAAMTDRMQQLLWDIFLCNATAVLPDEQRDNVFARFEQQLPVEVNERHQNFMEDDEDDDYEQEWSEAKKDDVVHFFQAASICTDSACEHCLFWNELKTDLEEALRNRTVFATKIYRRILSVISVHSCNCEDIFCVVPFCWFFHQCERDEVEEQIARLVRFYVSADWNEPFEMNRSDDADDSDVEPDDKFIQIESSLTWNSILCKYARCPQVRLDYDVFEMKFGQFGKIVISGQAITVPPEYINIYQYTLLEDVDHNQIWNSLRVSRQHENIVHLHWVYWNSKLFSVCFDFAGSLTIQGLISQSRGQLPLDQVSFYMRQVMSAVTYLHSCGVLYLLWTASSIALVVNSSGRYVVKLADFSFAVYCSDADDKELGSLMALNLPPNIVPPEMFRDEIGKFSDVWGLGCLMYEMIVGSPIHRDKIHQSREKLRHEVKNCQIEVVSQMTSIPLLHAIFKDKVQRIPCHVLAARINNDELLR